MPKCPATLRPSSEQVLLFTLMAKLAVGAVLATMLVRFPWFRRILPDRKAGLARAAGLRGQPRPAADRRGHLAAAAQQQRRRPDALRAPSWPACSPAPTPARSSASCWASRRSFAGEWGALPFAIGCGFAGGGLRELCPPEAIWHFSPLFFTGPAPPRLEAGAALRDRLGRHPARGADRARDHRAGGRLPVAASGCSSSRATTPGLWAAVLVTTVLSVAIPIKIWNSARIEHRLQEQEKLLMAVAPRRAGQPDQPALPVQHADLGLVADPLGAGEGADADREAVGAAAPAAAQPGALRHAARGARGDRRVSRHREHPLRAAAEDREAHRPGDARSDRARA